MIDIILRTKGPGFFFTNGLESAALKHLETIQVLRA